MAQKSLTGSLALTKMKSAFYTTKKGARCLMIPIAENHLHEKDGAVYLPISLIVKDEKDQYGQNGFISQSVSSEEYKALGKDKVKELGLPILGNVKDWSTTSNDSAQVYEAEVMEGAEDDLPF